MSHEMPQDVYSAVLPQPTSVYALHYPFHNMVPLLRQEDCSVCLITLWQTAYDSGGARKSRQSLHRIKFLNPSEAVNPIF